VTDPDMAVRGHIAPATIAVRHVVDDNRRPPIGPVFHVDPFAGRGEFRHAQRGRLDSDAGRDPVPAVDEQFAPFAVPRIKGVFEGPVKRYGFGGEHAGVHIHALRFHGNHGRLAAGAHVGAAPAHRNNRRPVCGNIHAGVRVLVHLYRARGRRDDEIAGTAVHAVHVDRTGPDSHCGAGRQGGNLRLASIRHAQVRTAGKFDFSGSLAVYPEGVAAEDQRVDRGVGPLRRVAAHHQRAAGVETDPRMQYVLPIGRERRSQADGGNERQAREPAIALHGIILHSALLCASSYQTNWAHTHSIALGRTAASFIQDSFHRPWPLRRFPGAC